MNRKRMPKPTVVHQNTIQRIMDTFTPDQIQEAIEDFEWHADQADESWDWDAPSERDTRLCEIKTKSNGNA